MYFKRAHRVETQQNIELMAFAVTWSANIFVGCSVTPNFFSADSLPFIILSIVLKNKKNLYVGSFNYFSYTNQIGSNWYMDTGVRDLEVACFKANSTWINDTSRRMLLSFATCTCSAQRGIIMVRLSFRISDCSRQWIGGCQSNGLMCEVNPKVNKSALI